MLATAGISTAVAAMLFMNADSTPLVIISTAISRNSLLPTRVRIRLPTMSATPVSSNAAPTMKTPSIVITADDANPVNASSGSR